MARNSTFPLAGLLEKEKLHESGTNFVDWYRNVRIVLKGAKKDYVLEATLGDPPADNATEDAFNVFQTRSDDYISVQCALLACMEPELQRRFEDWGPFETINELKNMFQQQARAERYEISQALLDCKMAEGSSVSAHVIKLHGYAQRLEALGVPFPVELGTDIILKSLPPSFAGFVMNYNMHGMNKSLSELFAMLKVAEKDIQKNTDHVMMVNKTTKFKKSRTANRKKGSKGKGESRAPKKPKAGPATEAECFFCKEKGHWKRNCPKYLAEKKKTGGSSSGILDIHVIDVYLSGPRSNSWVFDTGSVAHICNTMQELRNA